MADLPENVRKNYSPEMIGYATKMPMQAVRVLRELMDAAESQFPLESLIRAHRELESYIGTARQNYLNQASGMMDTAGASADVHLVQPFPDRPGQEQKKPTGVTGFQPNKED